jgi:N-acetylglucosaminyldiphosphoundecaprenol N-acetyl-beta-D-mannosaminyltransferase
VSRSPRPRTAPISEVKTVDLLGLTFPLVDYAKTLAIFEAWIDSNTRKAHQVCTVNVHTLTTCQRDPQLMGIMRRAALLTMDGQPLRWLANLKYGLKLKERVCGPDLMLRCFAEGQRCHWKHYLLGGAPQTLERLVAALSSQFPQATVVGYHSPPFRPLSQSELEAQIKAINQAAPDFLWVGLGAPKQEKWIDAHRDAINVPVQIGVGAAFDFISGNVARAPVWLQRFGLEWFFRTLRDPRRLWKRYLTTNAQFFIWALMDLLRSKKSSYD